MSKPYANRFDRRRFLLGAAGCALAVPMLETLAPRRAFAQTAGAPKRLLIIHTQDGRLVGDGQMVSGQYNDAWSPGRATGPLPVGAAPSRQLAPLQAVRDEVVTIDGIDNLVRHTVADGEGHVPAQKTILTCRSLGSGGAVVAPSFDYFLGTRLRPNASLPASVVISGTASDYTWRAGNTSVFFGAGGANPNLIAFDPAAAINELFGPPKAATTSGPPPVPTLAERLSSQRKSVLDGVLGSLGSLRGRVNAADRARLDAHAEFIRSVEQRSTGGPGAQASSGCKRPSEASVPSNLDPSGNAYQRGERDAVMIPAIVENIVQAFACDVTRVASLFFYNGDDPIFPTQFPAGASPFVGNNWHATIHGVPRIAENPTDASSLIASYNFYASTFTQIVQRLASMTDVDGSRLLDNTLILWVSEMGYGSVHGDYNIPVVMAGMKSAFSKGQGRHVVCSGRRSMGDLFAQILRMYGGNDTTYGDTGTIGDHNSGDLISDAGWPGFIQKSTPLHAGAIDL
ncbi:MAG: DUF1552 domain-containing protein [Polyangiaceae bacterium]